MSAGRTPILPALCGGDGHDWANLMAGLDATMRLTSPTAMLLSWGLMLVAMMLPLLHRPLAGIGDRAAATQFVIAYAVVWMPAIAAIALASTVLALATRAHPIAGVLIAAGTAIAWQGSGTRAQCLRRCHDALPVGGYAAGASFALSCVGACWALMLLPNLAGPAHVAAMLAVTILLVHERGRAPVPGRRAMLIAFGIVLAGVGCGLSSIGGTDATVPIEAVR